MASTKAALKAAKSALDAQKWEEAASQARLVTQEDPQNYFGTVFLGRALEKQNRLDEAADAYLAGTKLKPEDELGWKGVCGVYEAQGSKNVSKHTSTSLSLAQVYADKSDLHQCQTVLDRLVTFANEHGSRSQYMEALQAYLPSSPVYDFLEGRIQSPAVTYRRLAELTESNEKERINKEVGERRTRLGAKIGQVTNEVRREVFNNSDLEQLYQHVIDWTNDDEERRTFEERLLKHAYDHLLALPNEDKSQKRSVVLKLAHDMVIINHPYPLAWHIELEWQDVDELMDMDRNTLLRYVQHFPTSGTSKVIQGFLGVAQPPATTNKEDDQETVDGVPEEEEEKKKPTPLNSEERLLLIDDGLTDTKDSAFAQRAASQFFLELAEYESCVDSSRKAQKALQSERQKSGLRLEHSVDALSTTLGTALVYYQSPKNHPEAQILFDDVLKRRPNTTAALLGTGLIYEEQEDFEKATDLLEKALGRDPNNLRVAAEAAWCKSLNGALEEGLKQLHACLEQLQQSKTSSLDLKSQVFYRIGKCTWDLYPDKTARKDRRGAYANFISSVKANPSFAPAYTSLGLYYADYSRDRKRSRQCFQKAFELSASEVVAAERLARDFANDSDWDLVEVIAQRAIDSGVVRPAPGSKRKAISWPFAALAVVQMNKQDFPRAVQSYQAALRISPKDYNSWVGLGESYLSSGRYNTASKTLDHAEELIRAEDETRDTWFAQYMHANVHRELGYYDEAIQGYRRVLETRPQEFGVSIALLQTLVESAHHSIETGFFGKAGDLASSVVRTGLDLASTSAGTVNFWKAIGDACMIFRNIPGNASQFPSQSAIDLLKQHSQTATGSDMISIDTFSLETLEDAVAKAKEQEPLSSLASLQICTIAGILAQKQSINAASSDVHAQSVTWFNLGWTHFHARKLQSLSDEQDPLTKTFAQCARASVRCFKRAIELEASNADFWNALGVATTDLNAKVAQHSFVRSLHLNERSARTWTNLGTLYMLQEDVDLAHNAFARAQSTDPDYAYAWIGEGLIALHIGDLREARLHFTHALEIADTSVVAVKGPYAAASFDYVLSSVTTKSHVLQELVSPIFALQQLETQAAGIIQYSHLLALLDQHVGDHETAAARLSKLSENVETTYEKTESSAALGQFTRVKADLARSQLALRDFEAAVESATTAIDMSEEFDADAMSDSERSKTRLSAHLTAGLAHYYLGAMDSSVDMFRAALKESDEDADVICLLARVLWAKGGEKERSVARDQLFDAIERHAGHVRATTILGAMSIIDADETTRDAVIADLQTLRSSSKLTRSQDVAIEELLQINAALSEPESSADLEEANEIRRSIMLHPHDPTGWTSMAKRFGDVGAAELAVKTANQAMSPEEALQAQQMAEAFLQVPSVASAQKAAVLCPWMTSPWKELHVQLTTKVPGG